MAGKRSPELVLTEQGVAEIGKSSGGNSGARPGGRPASLWEYSHPGKSPNVYHFNPVRDFGDAQLYHARNPGQTKSRPGEGIVSPCNLIFGKRFTASNSGGVVRGRQSLRSHRRRRNGSDCRWGRGARLVVGQLVFAKVLIVCHDVNGAGEVIRSDQVGYAGSRELGEVVSVMLEKVQ